MTTMKHIKIKMSKFATQVIPGGRMYWMRLMQSGCA